MPGPHRLRPTPKLGQHFLVDDRARHEIADLVDLHGRTVLEIGPGKGALTTLLAARAERLVCVELDTALAEQLRDRYSASSNVEIVEADILKTQLASLLNGRVGAVIGNLPYYITSDILLHLYRAEGVLDVAILMMQREVADRVAAKPGSRDYGLLSVTTALYADAHVVIELPPAAFSPPPKVDSSVVLLRFTPRYRALGLADPVAFERWARTCFQQKRKTLANNLQHAGWPAAVVHTGMQEAGIAAGVRAEQVAPAELAKLHRVLTATSPLQA